MVLIHSVKLCFAAMAPLNRVKSRWQWALIRPGSSVLAPRSVTVSPGWAGKSEAGPTATISDPSTRTAPRTSGGDETGRTTSARYNIGSYPKTRQGRVAGRIGPESRREQRAWPQRPVRSEQRRVGSQSPQPIPAKAILLFNLVARSSRSTAAMFLARLLHKKENFI